MARRIVFNNENQISLYTLVLSKRDYTHIGIIENVSSLVIHNQMNGANEISFNVDKIWDGVDCSLWDSLTNFMLVYVKELDEYYEVTVEIDDTSSGLSKKINGITLCEAELSQYMLNDIEINTDKDGEVSGGSVLWIPYGEEGHDSCILARVLHDKGSHYSIGHVDSSLTKCKRTPEFSIDGTSIYDFLTGDLADEFDCLFLFNSTSRTIHVYDLLTSCHNIECGYYIETGQWYRGEFNDKCPKCNSSEHLYYYGNDTTVYVDKDNLTDQINFQTDTDSVKNCFLLSSGDENFAGDIVNMNMGSQYIYRFSDEMYDAMSEELSSALQSYFVKVNDMTDEYQSYVAEYYDCLNELAELEHTRMPVPAIEVNDNILTNYISLINHLNSLNEIGIQSETDWTVFPPSLWTFESGIKNYCKALPLTTFNSGRFKVEMIESSKNGDAQRTERKSPLSGGNIYTQRWKGIIRIIDYSANEDKLKDPDAKMSYPTKLSIDAFNSLTQEQKDNWLYYCIDIHANVIFSDSSKVSNLNLTMSSDYDSFIDTKVKQQIRKDDTDEDNDNTIYDMVGYTLTKNNSDTDRYYKDEAKVAAFKEALALYSRARLQSFYDATEVCVTILQEMGWAKSNPIDEVERTQQRYYQYNYYEKMGYISYAIALIDIEIQNVTDKLESAYSSINVLKEQLNLKSYLGDDLYKEFLSHLREDRYDNSNFAIYDQDGNTDRLERAKEYLDKANQELIKASTEQHTISADLYDLLALEEFKPIVDDFQLGNFIRVLCDGNIYRLRLIGYTINFDDFTHLDTEFSDMTQTADGVNDVKSILQSAQSMSTSYSYVSKQAENGNIANNSLEAMRETGLDSALTTIKNNNNEEFIINESGILGRSYDEQSETYDYKQLRITHNILAFTKDNWQSVSLALGEHRHPDCVNKRVVPNVGPDYGLSADFVNAGIISGSKMISGEIFSENYNYYGQNTIGSHINLNNGTFELGDGKIVYDNSTLTLKGISLNFDNNNITGSIGSDQVDGYNDFKAGVQGALMDNPSTVITPTSIISPKIGGGYLYITGNNGSVEINPKNYGDYVGKSGKIFNVINKYGESVVNIDPNGNAYFKGEVQATSGKFTGEVQATSGKFTGEINAGLGNIGGWSINTNSIYKGEASSGLMSINSNTKSIISQSSTNKIELNSGELTFYYKNSGSTTYTQIGSLTDTYWSGTATHGLILTGNTNSFLAIGTGTTSSGALRAHIVINNGLNPDGITQEIQLLGSTYFNTDIKVNGDIQNNLGNYIRALAGGGHYFSNRVYVESTLYANNIYNQGGTEFAYTWRVTNNGWFDGSGVNVNDRIKIANNVFVNSNRKIFSTDIEMDSGSRITDCARIELKDTYDGMECNGWIACRQFLGDKFIGFYQSEQGAIDGGKPYFINISAHSFIVDSDIRLKDIDSSDDNRMFDLIMGLKPFSFTWNNQINQNHDKVHMGFSAQDTNKLLKEIYGEDGNGMIRPGTDDDLSYTYGMDYSEIIAPLVYTVQVQQKRIEALEKYVYK